MILDSFETRPTRFHDVSQDKWGSWIWQQQNRLRTPEDFDGVVNLSEPEVRAFIDASNMFKVAVTPHYAALMGQQPSCPIRQQSLPQVGELEVWPFELEDPLAEEQFMPVEGLTHRYPDRALLYVTHNCPVYCRHCTRKRKVANPATTSSNPQLDSALAYIADHDEIRDVIVSGGDPLSLSNARLATLLRRLREIDHLDVIRIGTRNPVTLPQRIDDELAQILAEHAPIYVHTHFNHPREVTTQSVTALQRMVSAGCVLGNQMVLMRGVNDDVETVLELNRLLLRHGCRPYYMLQCDMAQGITHFRTPIQTGLDIVAGLRGRIGGLGIPDFVVDLPGGGGKIELTPDYLVEERPHEAGRELRFRNYAGKEYTLVDVVR